MRIAFLVMACGLLSASAQANEFKGKSTRISRKRVRGLGAGPTTALQRGHNRAFTVTPTRHGTVTGRFYRNTVRSRGVGGATRTGTVFTDKHTINGAPLQVTGSSRKKTETNVLALIAEGFPSVKRPAVRIIDRTNNGATSTTRAQVELLGAGTLTVVETRTKTIKAGGREGETVQLKASLNGRQMPVRTR